MSMFLFVFILSFSFISYLAPAKISKLLILLVLLHVLVFMYLKKGLSSLLFFISSVSILGIITAIYAFIDPFENYLLVISLFLAYTLILFIIWYLIHQQQLSNQTKADLEKRLQALEKYISISAIYTLTEFEDRSRMLINGCQRRNEDAYFITISVATNTSAQKAVFLTVGDVLLNVVRTEYDILGKVNDDTYILFLQNITEDKIDIVLNRFYKNLEEVISIDKITFTTNIQHYNSYIFKGDKQ